MERDRSRSPRFRTKEGVRQRAARLAEEERERALKTTERPLGVQAERGGGSGGKDAGEEFHDHVANLYLRNKMSAEQTGRLVRKANAAGAQGVESLTASTGKRSDLKNAQRGLMRNLIKKSEMPEPYWEEIPVAKEPGSKEMKMVWLPFLLIHEVIRIFMKRVDVSEMAEFEDLTMEKKRKILCEAWGADLESFIPIGFHMDGVPHQKNRTVEVISWNCCANPMWERFLFGCCEKAYLCGCGCFGRHTIDAILEVYVWSLRVLELGFYPECRRDGSPWRKSDKYRMRLKGELGFSGGLFQIRGDWACYKQIFGFKGWASESICWKCWANKSTMPYTDFKKSAKWRKKRHKNLKELIKRLDEEGATVSPLFGVNGMEIGYITIDVLHALDLGATKDAIGNLMWECLGTICKGRSRKDQVGELWKKMKNYYKIYKPPSQIQKLTEEMIKCDKKPPKLRTKGGETRGLVAFALELAVELDEHLDTPWSRTVLGCFNGLMEIYLAISFSNKDEKGQFDSSTLQSGCQKFLDMYKSLGGKATKDWQWKTKPKFHMVQELCEYMADEIGNPAFFLGL